MSLRTGSLRRGIVCGVVAVTCGTGAANADQNDDGVRMMQKAIEITVRDRGNPLDPVIAVAGVLTLQVRIGDGRFVGWITPGFRVPAGAPATVGTPVDSVLFRLTKNGFVGSPRVSQLAVDGQFNDRGVNMVVHDVTGPGQDIFALGTTERFMGNPPTRDPGRIAGPGVGPVDGDRVDWAVRSETVCVREVRQLPLQDDGSGGDVTVFTNCISIRITTLQPIG
jgi:hypothetical protein